MICIFIVFRNQDVLCPSNMVFLSYMLYVIFPCSLFYFLDVIEWEYILPWGKINDWSQVSTETSLTFFYVFTLFFFSTRILESIFADVEQSNIYGRYRLRSHALLCWAGMLGFGGLYFIHVTGGLGGWIVEYSASYLQKKEGHGLLNITLILCANFMAFMLGFYIYTNKKYNYTIIIFVISVLILSAYIQGIKSRILYFMIFFSIPWLGMLRISILKGIGIFIVFIFIFSVAMYFRSDGFYSSPSMLLEYILSYFNTVFLHERVVQDMEANFFQTLHFPVNKIMTYFGEPSESFLHEISRWLTSIYFPQQWFESHATQQWPIETELYLNYGYYIFWIIPIFIYSLFICSLYRMRYRLGPVFLYVYISELLYFLIIFRGSMFVWIHLFHMLFYTVLIVIGYFMLFKRVKIYE